MNIKALLSILVVLCYFNTSGIAQYDPDALAFEPENTQCNNKLVFLKVENMPELIGGKDNLIKKINNKVEFQRSKKVKYITCKVAVNCEGKVYDSEIIINSLDKEKGKEILELVENNIEFSPARHKDEPVDCYYYFYFYVKNSRIKSYDM